jgi:hypothetical protein
MRYKGNDKAKSPEYAEKLRVCAETIQQVNITMQELYSSLYEDGDGDTDSSTLR